MLLHKNWMKFQIWTEKSSFHFQTPLGWVGGQVAETYFVELKKKKNPSFFCNLNSLSIVVEVSKHDFSVQIWTFHSIPENCLPIWLHLTSTLLGWWLEKVSPAQNWTFNAIPQQIIFCNFTHPTTITTSDGSGGWQTWLFCVDLHMSCISKKEALQSPNVRGLMKHPSKGLCKGLEQRASQRL